MKGKEIFYDQISGSRGIVSENVIFLQRIMLRFRAHCVDAVKVIYYDTCYTL